MSISKRRLERMIKEELHKMLSERPVPGQEDNYQPPPMHFGDDAGAMQAEYDPDRDTATNVENIIINALEGAGFKGVQLRVSVNTYGQPRCAPINDYGCFTFEVKNGQAWQREKRATKAPNYR